MWVLIYFRIIEREDYMKKVFKIGCLSLLGLFVIGLLDLFSSLMMIQGNLHPSGKRSWKLHNVMRKAILRN